MVSLIVLGSVAYLFAEGLVRLSSIKRRSLFAGHRKLMHLPNDSAPKRSLRFWGNLGWTAGASRRPIIVISIVCVIVRYITQ